MTTYDRLAAIRDFVQFDIGERGLAKIEGDNLLTAFPNDFANACRSIAGHKSPRVGIVTGFMIPSVDPPMGETDGPLGAIFLARSFAKLGIPTTLISDASAMNALRSAVSVLPELAGIELIHLPPADYDHDPADYRSRTFGDRPAPTHLIALERAGLNYGAFLKLTPDGREEWEFPEFTGHFIKGVSSRICTMRGRDITALTMPAQLLFEHPSPYVTIGIGDGGNEIGMGKITWRTIQQNIPNGGKIACSVPTDHLIVAGISNWGAYALAAGVMLLRDSLHLNLFDLDRERELLENMVAFGPLIDGVTGKQTASVDGIEFDRYAKILTQISDILASGAA